MGIDASFLDYENVIAKARGGDIRSQKIFYKACQNISIPIFAKYKSYINKFGSCSLDFEGILNHAVFYVLSYENFRKIVDFRGFFVQTLLFFISEILKKNRKWGVYVFDESEKCEEEMCDYDKGGPAFYERLSEGREYVYNSYKQNLVNKIKEGHYTFSPVEYLYMDVLFDGKNAKNSAKLVGSSYYTVLHTIDECFDLILREIRLPKVDKNRFKHEFLEFPAAVPGTYHESVRHYAI